ncbi:MAG: L-carnitine dehydratase/bile acid-inducible protein, partial [Ilumatobacteraceae bacterium]|nr:L-carnitine dehydratase/bile acid-inducible protein [Ilumatobacteraceae bacterium]
RLFAAVGADVVCLEPPQGAQVRRVGPWIATTEAERRSAMWEYLGSGKRSAALCVDDERVDELLSWAELVISSFEGDASAAAAFHQRVADCNPRAVHVVVSGFGMTGPYRDWRHTPLTEWAAGGHLYITGEPDREPVQGGGPWVSYLTGAIAAIGAVAALFDTNRTGIGQLVDVGEMEAAASLHQWTLTMYTHTGYVKRRWGNLLGEWSHPIGLYPCRDGWISIVAVAPHQWEALCVSMELWELAADARLEVIGERFDRAAEIDAQITGWLSTRTVDEAVEFLQTRNVPASRALKMTEVLHEEQLNVRDFWRHPDGFGPDARLPWRPFVVGSVSPEFRPAPSIGQHTDDVLAHLDDRDDSPRPALDLSTVRVVECGVAWAGPLAGRFLGDLGADVVKVEHPGSRGLPVDASKAEAWSWGELPHPQIRSQVFADNMPGVRWWNRSGVFNKMNRSKRGVSLDVKQPAGREIFRQLLATADLVLHNYSPRGARSMEMDAASVSKLSDRAMTLSMTGYGVSGPLAANLSYGPVLQGHAGFDDATGYVGAGPTRLGVAFPDPVGGVHGAFAGLVALWYREVTGVAHHVDLSQLETLMSIAGEMFLTASVTGEAPVRHGNRSIDIAPQNVYRCAGDDSWVAVSVTGDDEWRALVDAIGDVELIGHREASVDRRRAIEPELDVAIERWTRRQGRHEAAAALQRIGIAAFPAVTNADLASDPQLAARGFVAEWDQPDVGVRGYPGFPIHFEHAPVHVRPAPQLGGDNDAVLRELPGMDDARLEQLRRDGVVWDHPIIVDWRP